MKKSFVYFLFFLLFSYACKKEKDDIVEKRPFCFSFYNTEDTSLYGVGIYTSFIYPNEDLQNIIQTGKWKPYADNDRYKLHYNDSVIVISPDPVYEGCSYRVSITIWKLNKYGAGVSKTYTKHAKINDINNSKIIFRWPSDTLNYELQID